MYLESRYSTNNKDSYEYDIFKTSFYQRLSKYTQIFSFQLIMILKNHRNCKIYY
jgi:hypothetical protein